MTRQRVLQFEYQQALVHESSHPGWSESLEISVRILAAAIYSGWYSENFGSRGNDFVVLLAIAIHARPLKGDDLKLLVDLGMAKPEDEGRLYARVTDMGLAAELGMSRDTVARAAERLHKRHAIDTLEVPEGLVSFRDSHGQFNGSKVYLLSGDIQSRFLEKEVLNRAAKSSMVDGDLMRRAAENSTVEADFWPGDAKNSTVEGQNEPDSVLEAPDRDANCHTVTPDRAEICANRAANSGTNLKEEEEEEGGRIGETAPGDPAQQVFAYFARCKGISDYQPSRKDQSALKAMLTDGYSLQEILDWIDLAFAQPKKPQHFTFVHILARQSRLAMDNRPPQRSDLPDAGRSDPHPNQPDGGSQTVATGEIEAALGIYQSTGREVNTDVLARLRLLAGRCDAAAREQGSSGGAWLADALEAGLGIADPNRLLNYAATVLADWTANGKPGRTMTKTSETAPDDLAPELVIFQEATGGRLPLPDQRQIVIDAIRQCGFTAEYLRPFWDAWVAQDRKRSSLDWLLDWADKGAIPQPYYGKTQTSDKPEFKSLSTIQTLMKKYGGTNP